MQGKDLHNLFLKEAENRNVFMTGWNNLTESEQLTYNSVAEAIDKKAVERVERTRNVYSGLPQSKEQSQ